MEESIYYKEEGPIGWIIFNRPEKRNALNLEMWQKIPEFLEILNNNEEIRVIILKGKEDNAFIAGADISEFKESRSSIESAKKYNEITQVAFRALRESKNPTIAMIEGFCIGGGCAIALNCDLRVASRESVFALPPAKLGLAYGFDNVKQVVDIVGPSNAREMLFTARTYNGEEALKIGLIHRMIEKSDIQNFMKEYTEHLIHNAPLSIQYVKAAINEYLKQTEDRDFHKLEKFENMCYDSEDYAEGYNAFLEKRKPVFKGK